MINKTYYLWKKEEYAYPVARKFIPNIVSYLHDEDNRKRLDILVVPGGGYAIVSASEGEIVAKEFYDKGYNAVVVTYTTNPLMDVPLKLQPLKDLSKAVMLANEAGGVSSTVILLLVHAEDQMMCAEAFRTIAA